MTTPSVAEAIERFPIMGREYATRRGYVPMSFMRRFQSQAKSNHSQTIERLAERGGLTPQEAMALVQGVDWGDRRWKKDEPAWANLKIIVSAEFPDFDFGDRP